MQPTRRLEVTSPTAGKIVKLLVKMGDQIKVGQPYCIIESTNGEAPTVPAKIEKVQKAATKRQAESKPVPSVTLRPLRLRSRPLLQSHRRRSWLPRVLGFAVSARIRHRPGQVPGSGRLVAFSKKTLNPM